MLHTYQFHVESIVVFFISLGRILIIPHVSWCTYNKCMVSPRNSNGMRISQLAIVSNLIRKGKYETVQWLFRAGSSSNKKNTMGYDTRWAWFSQLVYYDFICFVCLWINKFLHLSQVNFLNWISRKENGQDL